MRRGLTLLEIIITLSLTGVLLSGVYIFYANTLRTREMADRKVTDVQLLRVTLERIADDVRNAAGFAPEFGSGIKSEMDKWRNGSIEIYRHVLPGGEHYAEYDTLTDELPPAKGDLRLIRYNLVLDEEHKDENNDPEVYGLFRSEQETLLQTVVMQTRGTDMDAANPLDRPEAGEEGEPPVEAEPLGIQGKLIATEIKYLRFSFYDGADWVDQWTGMDKQGNTLPQAVRITIGREKLTEQERQLEQSVMGQLDEEKRQEIEYEHGDRMSMIVRLPQADRSMNSRLANIKQQFGSMESELRDQADDFKQELRSKGGGIGRKSR